CPRCRAVPHTTLFRSESAQLDEDLCVGDCAHCRDHYLPAGNSVIREICHCVKKKMPYRGSVLTLCTAFVYWDFIDWPLFRRNPRSEEHTSELQSRFDI